MQLIDELAQTYSTIALSLDIWTSKNHKAILGVISHWVSTDFKYQERVLEFSELAESHSEENMAETLQKMLIELYIEEKLQYLIKDVSDSKLKMILSKFDKFTQLVSWRQFKISLAISIYYELNDMLEDAASAQGNFLGFSSKITSAISAGMKKYKKYYKLMDAQDAYNIALVLDPRFKTLLLDKELRPVTAPKVIQSIKDTLHEQFLSKLSLEQSRSKLNQDNKRQILEARILQKLQSQVI
ncbi:putative AC9 transposase [Aspergillus affinis]|uniref:putative AC9 transposase n=1 Tax=Aspergillus affinis TaxID=1070780 RepID=UPI0022FE6106|nr:putative AC9 transposase [Aspergillus affinis]KAI9036875.1 putative AC9 transposase [Aspergillus affinis]